MLIESEGSIGTDLPGSDRVGQRIGLWYRPCGRQQIYDNEGKKREQEESAVGQRSALKRDAIPSGVAAWCISCTRIGLQWGHGSC